MYYSPRIVTSGCVLALDAADKLSYPGSGTSWLDLSGNGNTGTLTNGPTFSAANQGSIVFNGSTHYVDISTLKLFTTTTFSLGFWIKVSSFSSTVCSGVVSNQLYTIFGTTSLYQTYTNTFSTCIQTGATANTVGTIQQSGFSVNTWYYYFTVYDGTQSTNATKLQLYLNAVSYSLAYDGTVPSVPYNNNTATRIGYGLNANYQYFNGNIASVIYYNRALTATEILQNYNATKSRFGL